MTLICPLCSESLEEEGAHFYKHFKYKRYACGQNSCDSEFYTEAERNAHCTKHGHKRSFQKTVNPYIDKMISMITADARELITKDMDTVLQNRFGSRNARGISESSSSTTATTGKRHLLNNKSSTSEKGENSEGVTPSAKKKRTLIAGGISTPTSSSANSASTSSPSASTSASAAKKAKIGAAQPQQTPVVAPNQRKPVDETPRRSTEVDSTTVDQPVVSSAEKPKKSRKKRNDSEAQISSAQPQSYEQMSAIDKLIGWFDPNVPERQQAAKVACSVCNQEIIYDFIIRKSHVTEKHMAADVHPDDYEDILRTAMDLSFPDLPNSNLACQLCMTGNDVRKCTRREHIEKAHTTSLPPLTCPHEGCNRGFRRQCELSSHMKDAHRIEMSRHKDPIFQTTRRRRNFMINEMIDKCFPWSKLEKIEQIVSTSSENAPEAGTSSESNRERYDSQNGTMGDVGFNRDVRVMDVNKTRRAPQYNQDDSTSSESDDDDTNAPLQNPSDPSDADDLKTAAEDFSEDVIYLGFKFNAEIAEKLAKRACIPVKPEPRENSAEPMETQRIHGQEEMEVVKEEENTEGLSPPTLIVPVLHSPYAPLDPSQQNVSLPPSTAPPNAPNPAPTEDSAARWPTFSSSRPPVDRPPGNYHSSGSSGSRNDFSRGGNGNGNLNYRNPHRSDSWRPHGQNRNRYNGSDRRYSRWN